jgi:hypothetical protein
MNAQWAATVPKWDEKVMLLARTWRGGLDRPIRPLRATPILVEIVAKRRGWP